MKKIFKMSIHEIKQLRKVLIIMSVITLLTTVSVLFTKNNKDINSVFLIFADLVEKLLIPVFIYIGIKDYDKSLNNTIQINQKRSEYLIAKSLSIIAVSCIVAIIVTPLSYYFAELGKFDLVNTLDTVFMGFYTPTIPNIFGFGNIIVVTVITILLYSLISCLSLLTVALFKKIGGVKLFIIYFSLVYIFNYFNTIISMNRNGFDIINSILGFSSQSKSLVVPIFTLSTITLVISMITYITINQTEV